MVSALVGTGALGLLTVLVWCSWEPLEALDRDISDVLGETVAGQPLLVAVMQVVTEVGRPLTWWIVHTAATVHFFVRRRVRKAFFVAVTAGGGGLLNSALKSLVGRERPDWSEPLTHAAGFAFPSGHTTGTAIGVGVLLIVLVPVMTLRWRWVMIAAGTVLVVAVGVSRVILGVHWVSDVLGSWLLSAVWVLTMAAAFRPLRVHRDARIR